jgi:rare lipoprotein A
MPALRNGLIVLSCLLAACSGGVKDGPPDSIDYEWDQIPDAQPKDEAKSRYGNPASYEVFGKEYRVMQSAAGFTQDGVASWYGSKFHGQRTSSGETYDMHAMTAAHKSLPLPCYVEVTNHNNGRKAIVKVNDRGPFHGGRIIDLSYAAATKLGVAQTGTAPVSIRVVTPETMGDANTQVASAGIKLPVLSRDEALVSDDGKLYVQVVAFSNENAALKMLQELRDKNFSSARIHVEKSKNTLLYRVRIGPVPTRDVAEKLLAQLKEIKYNDAKIVSYN